MQLHHNYKKIKVHFLKKRHRKLSGRQDSAAHLGMEAVSMGTHNRKAINTMGHNNSGPYQIC